MSNKKIFLNFMAYKNLLKDEAFFAEQLGRSLSPDLPEEEKRIIKIRYGLDYGGLSNFANGYLKRLTKAIRKGRVSMEGFTVKDAESFSGILSSEKLDKKLQSELSHLLYGADERKLYWQ